MSAFIVGVLGLLNLLGEATWLRRLAIVTITPNLSLILIVFWAILNGSEKGRRLGIWIGLLQDFMFCDVIGIYGLLYYIIGHFSGYFNKDFYRGHFILPLVVVIGADLLYGIFQYFIYCFFSGDLYFGFYLLHKILPEVCYTALVSVPLYPLVRLLHRGTKKLDDLIQSGKDRKA